VGERYGLSLFTGRLRYEADITLRRFAPCVKFDPMICADDVTAAKPAPEGLLAIQQWKPDAKLWYVGDTVDDARCARAANVPFIGIAAHTHTKRGELIRLFQQENAAAILENVNEIEGAL
jgi:HAD superfamily phosphatase